MSALAVEGRPHRRDACATFLRRSSRICLSGLVAMMAAVAALAGPMDDGTAAYLKGDYAAALKSFSAALDTHLSDTDKARCLYMTGQAHLMTDALDPAREAFTALVNQHAKSEWGMHARVGLGDVCFHEKNFADAAKHYLIAANDSQYAGTFGSCVTYRLAKTYRTMNNPAQARQYEQTLRTKYPQSLETLLMMKTLAATTPVVPAASAAPATPATPATPAPAPRAKATYVVQIATSTTSARATQLVASLRKKGITAHSEVYQQKTANAYRIIAGPYRTLKSANDTLAKVKQQGHPGAYLITIPPK